MIQKIKEFSDKRQNIYRNLITGAEGTIGQVGQTVNPSDRVNKRHPVTGTPKVRSNRATKKGRNIYYQPRIRKITNNVKIREFIDGKWIVVKTVPVTVDKNTVIKHVQETYDGIQRKTSLFNFYERIESNKAKWHEKHPEYKRKNS